MIKYPKIADNTMTINPCQYTLHLLSALSIPSTNSSPERLPLRPPGEKLRRDFVSPEFLLLLLWEGSIKMFYSNRLAIKPKPCRP